MTTAAEVRRWLKPLMKRHPNLVLVGRNLIIPPVRHILRGIYFDSSWDRALCRPLWYVGELYQFRHDGESPPFDLAGEFHFKRSTEIDFLPDLLAKIEERLQYKFTTIDTLAEYFEAGLNPGAVLEPPLHHSQSWKSRHFDYSVALAAQGRMEEANEKIKFGLEFWSRRAEAQRDQAEENSRKRHFALARDMASFADTPEQLAARLQRLTDLLQCGDRAGIGALLLSWEERKVQNLKIHHLWEPTPFPVKFSE